ncbi:MAG: hypothetical protein ACK4NY_19660 [Spirosomataceae bacterium]
METLLIEVLKPKGLSILKDLESLDIIKVLKREQPNEKEKEISKMFRGRISAEEGEKLNEYIKKSREEW